ncbi:glycosyltransferase family 4 protein [Candidatus Villigracilis saccharophilus]|uniref:glycosyltransferase family 4 protein n=1 Tax=Candidatus Villigracilis saccharophilus TaxID=3140684 RepID=UPI00313680E1|nr:glycosyltransferase family 4 protein [Anaerolineales bacterium]
MNYHDSLSVLLLGTQMATGGAQKVLLDQARWFHERGHKVTVIFLYDKEGLHEKWQALSPVPIINLKAFHGHGQGIKNFAPFVNGLFSLWSILRREKFDVIETFTHDSNMVALPIAWLARVPVRIATHHGVIEGFSRWRELTHSWMINHNIAHKLVTVSQKTYEVALNEGVRAERILVIQNGIAPLPLESRRRLEVRKEAGMDADDLVLLAVGRLVYQKAHQVLVASMPAVLKEFPNAKVLICGEGVLRADLQSQIEGLGLSHSVKLLGKSDHVASYLAGADIFVLPSRWEGLPIALLEAMSAGLPSVATKVEGVDEVLVEGVHGLLVPVENPAVLAEAILQLLRDPETRTKMGMAARQHISRFYTVDRMGQQYLDLMLNCLNENK